MDVRTILVGMGSQPAYHVFRQFLEESVGRTGSAGCHDLSEGQCMPGNGGDYGDDSKEGPLSHASEMSLNYDLRVQNVRLSRTAKERRRVETLIIPKATALLLVLVRNCLSHRATQPQL